MGTSLLFISAIMLSLVVTAIMIPNWIEVCRKWHLFERADDRKKHKISTPTMGGIAIFAGVLISLTVFIPDTQLLLMKPVMISLVLLFFTGFFDDLLDIRAMSKLLLQLIAAIYITTNDIRLHSLYGFMGIGEMPLWGQYITTLLFIIAITNAYNLIDGLDGLAAGLGIMASTIFGVLFIYYGLSGYAMLSFCLTGALIGFLYYNFHPAKIFMGDSGSLLIGFILSVEAITLLQQNTAGIIHINPLLIIAALFIPVYDMFRVSVIRVLTGYSPFRADRNHIHHMITANGFGQRVTSIMIIMMNLSFVILTLIIPEININLFVVLCICLGMITINTLVITWLVDLYRRLGGRVHTTPADTVH